MSPESGRATSVPLSLSIVRKHSRPQGHTHLGSKPPMHHRDRQGGRRGKGDLVSADSSQPLRTRREGEGGLRECLPGATPFPCRTAGALEAVGLRRLRTGSPGVTMANLTPYNFSVVLYPHGIDKDSADWLLA